MEYPYPILATKKAKFSAEHVFKPYKVMLL